MKIVRFLDSFGHMHFGDLQADGTAFRIEGDILGNHTVTRQKMAIAKLLAPIVPAAILCIGLNYRKHAAETGATPPEFPVLFFKNPAAVQNPHDPVELPRRLASSQVDYEAELAIVIRKRAKNVPESAALDCVLGFTAANDVSARDWQKQWGGSQWCREKVLIHSARSGRQLLRPMKSAIRMNWRLKRVSMAKHCKNPIPRT